MTRQWVSMEKALQSTPDVIRVTPRLLEAPDVGQPKILYSLACGHVVTGTGRPAPEMECHTHGLCKVADVHVHEWHAKCTTKGCKWARWTGLSRRLCATMANGHILHNPTHRGIIEYVANPEAIKVRDKLIRNSLIGF